MYPISRFEAEIFLAEKGGKKKKSFIFERSVILTTVTFLSQEKKGQ